MITRSDPDLPPKILETSETGEQKIYSGYLRLYNTIDCA